MTLTYKKAFDDVTNNAQVLDICGKLAESMAVPYDRVTDAYGGYYKNPSPTLPANSSAARRMLTTNTTNTTKTSWTVDLFVQPDPFAEKVDNTKTTAAASSTAAVTAINSVTEAKFGKATAAAAAVTEVAVKWVKAPAATGGSKVINIAGSTDKGGYVYCAVAKSSNRRRLNATNTTTTKAAATPVVKEVLTLQSAASALKYNIKRTKTKTGSLAFTFNFGSLLDGKTYDWMCEATSLNPSNPMFRTEMAKGS